jgi:hypothetical protein
MYDGDALPDDVPAADAAEQQRAAIEPVPDDEVALTPSAGPPLEAGAADWQEQSEIVEIDPDEEGRDV